MPPSKAVGLQAPIAVASAVLSGLLLAATYPPLGWWWAAIPAVALGLVALRGRSVGGALVAGTCSGLAFMLPLTEWARSFLGDSPLAWLPWVALASLEAVLLGIGAVFIALAWRLGESTWRSPLRRSVLLPLTLAVLWTAREVLVGSWPYGGFAWGRLGMSQSASPAAHLASWVGITGLSLLIALAAAALAVAVVARSRRTGASLAAATGALLVLAAVVPQAQTAVTGISRVAAVQGNGPAAYLDERDAYAVVMSQVRATAGIRYLTPDLVIWPEGSVDGDPYADPVIQRLLASVEDEVEAPLLVNAASRGPSQGEPIFNLSFLWEGGQPTQTHAKRNPVPFGEYVPERRIFEALAPDLIGMIQREYTAGDDRPVVEVGGVRVGLTICFDVVDDWLIREAVTHDPGYFAFQTNNADFRGTSENLQQLAFARMRAIETGRSVINLSTTGTSQVFAADGSILDTLPIEEPGVMVTDIEVRSGTTPGVAVGAPLGWLLLASAPCVVVGLAVVSRVRRPRPGALGGHAENS